MRILAAVTYLAAVAVAAPVAADDAAPTRVEIGLMVRGEIFSPTGGGTGAAREPIEVKAAFEFLEFPDATAAIRTNRRYRRATAAVQVGDRVSRATLGADARDVIVELIGTTPTPSLAESFLSRQEAELLDTQFDPLLLQRLAPKAPVAKGEPWKVPADVVAGLLAIDTVTDGGIDVTLVETGDDGATLGLTGTVIGAIDGVSTRITVKGTALASWAPAKRADYWHIAGPMYRLDVTLDEKREAGWVAPGLDVEATITMRRGDVPADVAWSGKHRLDPPAPGRPTGHSRLGTVWHRHPHGRYTLVLDRRWRVVEDGPEGLVMRLVDHGALVAQCSMLPLPRSAPDALPTVDEVSRDVEASLGEQFGQIAAAEAMTRDDGTHMVRVMAEGSAEGRPFRWIHVVLTNPEGYRSAVTFMLEPAMADRFGGADHELVAGIVLLPDPVRNSPAAASANRPGNRQAKLP